jgi:hypothetical protein
LVKKCDFKINVKSEKVRKFKARLPGLGSCISLHLSTKCCGLRMSFRLYGNGGKCSLVHLSHGGIRRPATSYQSLTDLFRTFDSSGLGEGNDGADAEETGPPLWGGG